MDRSRVSPKYPSRRDHFPVASSYSPRYRWLPPPSRYFRAASMKVDVDFAPKMEVFRISDSRLIRIASAALGSGVPVVSKTLSPRTVPRRDLFGLLGWST